MDHARGPRPPDEPPLPPPPPWRPVPARPDTSEPWHRSEDDRRRRSGRVVIAAIVIVGLVAASVGIVTGARAPSARTAVQTNDDYVFLQQVSDGHPYRWDPCVPIRYQVNPTNAPPYALDDVRGAIERAAAATGYRFVYEGTTDRTIDEQMGRAFQSDDGSSRWLPLLIAWVPRDHFDYLADTHRAAAFGMPKPGDGEDYATYESGLIAVDADGNLSRGFVERYSEGVVLMHELGHVLGLGHVGASDELMYSPNAPAADSTPNVFQNDWGPGDLNGLEILGRHGPCPSPG